MEASANLFTLNKDQLTETINSVKAKLKELGLDKLDFTLYRQLVLGARPNKQSTLVFDGLVSSAVKDKVDQLSEELKKILGSYGEDSYAVEVEVGIGDGENFPALENLNVVPSKESGKKYECASGEVVLVDFWATWCGPCQKPMQHNQEMLEKNEEKWKGKARIVGVSVDDDIESVIKRVEEKKWDKIEHYHAPGGFGAPAAAQFGINGIPCVFLVDKKGIIRYRGHPSSVNLEDKINELIAEDENTTTDSKPKEEQTGSTMVCTEEGCSIVHLKPTETLSIEKEIEMFKTFEEKYEAHKNLIEGVSGLNTVLVGTRVFKADAKETFDGRLILAGVVGSSQKDSILEFHKNVIQPFAKNLKFDNRLGIQDTPEVKYGSTCATCKKALGKGTSHYVCTACQCGGKEDHAFCLECADKELTQEINSGKDLFHQHGLLLVHDDSDEALKTLKRVMNTASIIPDDHPAFEQVKASKVCRGVYCDGCGGALQNYRWACANCGNFDYCTECYKASRDPNHEKHKEITEKGHDKSHVFYRSHYMMALGRDEPKDFEFPASA